MAVEYQKARAWRAAAILSADTEGLARRASGFWVAITVRGDVRFLTKLGRVRGCVLVGWMRASSEMKVDRHSQ